MKRYWRFLTTRALAVIATLMLTACEPHSSARDMLAGYRYRLGNALELSAEDSSQAAADARIELPRFPRQRDLLLPLHAASLSLLDFLRLSDCELQRLLGERNSVLGKVMATSRQLLYERQFIQLAEQCLATLAAGSGRSDLQAALQAALAAKRADAIRVSWNASAASAEFGQLFSLADGPVPPAEAALGPTELLGALRRLAYLLAAPEVPQAAALEALLQLVGSENIGGRLLQSQHLLATELNHLTRQMAAELVRRPLCYKPQPSPRARVAGNVFMRFYIGEVQPYISSVHRQSQALRSAVVEVLVPYQPWPAVFTDYWQLTWSEQNPASTWRRFQLAVSEHTRLWQQLLRECGMSPGGKEWRQQEGERRL